MDLRANKKLNSLDNEIRNYFDKSNTAKLRK